MSHLPAFTIASNNYLALATVWALSYREHHPGAAVYVLVVDRRDPEVDYEGLPYSVVFADEIGIPSFPSFAFRYDVLELNTAVKPFFLSYLRERHGHRRVFYFDPDILVLNTLSGLEASLEESQAVLTPHVTEPLDNTYNPTERKIRMLGVYNLGFLGIRLDETTAPFVEWWKDRLHRFCVVDPETGLFVDQSWMDFAPAFLERVAVVRDPIYNVAYWNLPHRRPCLAEGGWEVDGRRLGFFHFSGLDFDDLTTLSRHQNRIARGERRELRPLLEEYRDRVRAAGHDTLRRLPYRYDRFDAEGGEPGVPIPWMARRTLQRVDPRGRRFQDPFRTSGSDSFLAWLVEPVELPAGFLNRAVLALWEERQDLIRAFPEVCGKDLVPYVAWLHAQKDLELAPCFLEQVRARSAPFEGIVPAPVPFVTDPALAARELLISLDLKRPGTAVSWLNEALPGRRRRRPLVTRCAMLLHATRTDLQQSYPDPLGENQASFAYWFVTDGARELGLAPELVEPVVRSFSWRTRLGLRRRRRAADGAGSHAPARPVEAAAPRGDEAAWPEVAGLHRRTAANGGVNLLARLSAPTAAGRLGRAALAALEEAGRAVAAVDLDEDPRRRVSRGRFHPPDGTPFSTTLVQVEAQEAAGVLGLLPAAVTTASRPVGHVFWDLAHLPLELGRPLAGFAEVWAPSRFTAAALASLAQVPVRRVEPLVGVPEAAALERAAYGIDPEAFLLYAAVDGGRDVEQENPFAWIEVLRLLGGVELVVQVTGGGRPPSWTADFAAQAQGLALRVETGDEVPPHAFLAACDAYVSLRRARGFDVEAIEALHLGKPILATHYGGVTDFLDETTGYPVAFRPRALTRSRGAFPPGAIWAEPEIGDAVAQLRRLLADRDEAARRALAGQRRVRELYGDAERFCARLAEGRETV